jgi:CDP-diacylglycerol--glycerol-3-phosphate 3-phosphatidyltransferase
MKHKFVWNIPNVLSLYRLLMFPVILTLIFTKYETAFVWLFCINLVTDVADGFIARRFKMQTEFGALLDSWADVGTFILAFVGIIWFHSDFLKDQGVLFFGYLVLYYLQMVVSKIKFGIWVVGWHAYSVKVAGYLQAFFFVSLFTYGFIENFFYVVMAIGFLAEIELYILNFICKTPQRNVRGLYWYLKSTKS